MRKTLRFLFTICVISCPLIFADQAAPPGKEQKLEDFKKRYFDKNIFSFRNNVQVRVSRYDILLEIDRDSLSDNSRMLLDDILAILMSPGDEKLRARYMKDFPATFSEYCRVFPPEDRRELYYGDYVFLEMFEDILKEHPEEYVGHLISLSSNAERIADSQSPGLLQHILATFFCNSYEIIIPAFNQLDFLRQQNIVDFVCDYEAFPDVEVVQCIIKELRERKNTDLLKRFLSVKKTRKHSAIGDCAAAPPAS